MVKRRSPRIFAASALAALVVGLSACGTPQTLVPYTPAEGVNAETLRIGGPVDPSRGEVPLKVRNLLIVSQPGSNSGFLSGAIAAPENRADQLVNVEGQVIGADGREGEAIQPISANLELPQNQLVVLTDGAPLQVQAPELTPGLVAQLTLNFRDSEPVEIQVPIVDASKSAYEGLQPGGGEGEQGEPA
ncbi:MAG: hypothetical protein Q4F67_11275, partial [Propionibacteriaceae bacterium]|nr:hypothetical protein [Propionibacteriaceae bacterium]